MRKSVEKELQIKFKYSGDDYQKGSPVKLEDLTEGDTVLINTFWGNTLQNKQLINTYNGVIKSIDSENLTLECIGKPEGDGNKKYTKVIPVAQLSENNGAVIKKFTAYKKQYLDPEYVEEIGVMRAINECVIRSVYNQQNEGVSIIPQKRDFTAYNIKDNLFNVVLYVQVFGEDEEAETRGYINIDKLEKLMLDTYPLNEIIDAKSLEIEEI